MIDHFSMPVSDYAASKAFYTEAFKPLGWTMLMEVSAAQTEDGVQACGFGATEPAFWIFGGTVGDPCHVAVRVDSRKDVEAFHAAALQAGAKDNGAPGLRPHYGETYFAAFVHDLDGHNVEAVCYAAESGSPPLSTSR